MSLHLEAMDVSNFGVHHSSRVNCMCLGLCPLLLKCLETGCEVGLFTWGGYTVFELVSISLKFGGLLNPTNGLVVTIGSQSGFDFIEGP